MAGTLPVMKEHMARQAAERLDAGPGYQDHGLVFCKPDGRPISPRELLAWWHGLAEGVGIPRRRWHALRHSAAQRMLDRGVPLEIVSVILGHNCIAVTADVYGRARADRIRRHLADYDKEANGS